MLRHTMLASKESRLAEIARYSTRYEIVAESPAGARHLIGYTIRASRSGMMQFIWQRKDSGLGDRLIALTGIQNEIARYVGKGKLGIALDLGNGWKIRFSGRTERDAILCGELPRV